jgi:hypothetical protein
MAPRASNGSSGIPLERKVPARAQRAAFERGWQVLENGELLSAAKTNPNPAFGDSS